jgi:hypothetical protein
MCCAIATGSFFVGVTLGMEATKYLMSKKTEAEANMKTVLSTNQVGITACERDIYWLSVFRGEVPVDPEPLPDTLPESTKRVLECIERRAKEYALAEVRITKTNQDKASSGYDSFMEVVNAITAISGIL